jgi:transposase
MAVRRKSSASPFTATDRRRLARAQAEAWDVRVFRRLQAVLRVAEGMPVTEVARQAGVNRTSVHRWVNAYQTSRQMGELADAPRMGRPRAAEGVDQHRLAAVLAQDPRTLGYRATNWTAPLLAAHLRDQLGCAVSERTVRRRLREYGWRWKRPRHVYHERAAHIGQKKGRLSAA